MGQKASGTTRGASGVQGLLTLPLEVRRREWEHILKRRQAAGYKSKADHQLPKVGLALSGGGIRSATFSLGILQELAQRNVLRLADYMCTVSGGGYIGACLSSLMTQPPGTEEGLRAWDTKDKAGFDLHDNMPLLKREQIHHLRTHGDFLILREGVFRRGVLRAVGTITLGLACSLGMFAGVLIAVVAMLFYFGTYFGGAGLWQRMQCKPWPGWECAIRPLWHVTAATWGVMVAGAATALAGVIRARFPSKTTEPTPHETAEQVAEGRWLRWFGFGLPILIVLESCVALWIATRPPAPNQHAFLLLPFWGFLGAALLVGASYVLSALLATPPRWTQQGRSTSGAMFGICVYWAAAALIPPAFIYMLWLLSGLEWAVVGSGIVSLAAARLTARRGSKPDDASAGNTELFRRAAFAIAVPLALIAATSGLALGLMDYSHTQTWRLLIAGPGSILLLGVLVNFNRISPHYFYRDRLAEAYLQTEARGARGVETVRDDADLMLCDLHKRNVSGKPTVSPAPYHLIQCALNLPGSRDLTRKDRKSDHFIFSRYFCGSTTTGYAWTYKYRGGLTKLSRAMTISGAAASSNMGFYTSFSRSLALTLFNIRLGYWIVNPRVYEDETTCDGKPVVVYPPHSRPTSPSRQPGPFRRWAARSAVKSKEKWVFWPVYLFNELAAMTSARGALVNVSDGGHTGDNVGLVPLLQRRCKLIIACDGGCDPDYSFGSLAAAIRQIFTDENVEIEIDPDAIRPDEPEQSPKAHVMVGRIRYPKCAVEKDPANNETAGAPNDSDAGEGLLIYIKSTFLDEDEPATVKSYAAQHPEFPHETTADQFFDDAQFEAYRALGRHIARQWLDQADVDAGKTVAADEMYDRLHTYCSQMSAGRKQQIAERKLPSRRRTGSITSKKKRTRRPPG
ncbi:MAG: patatin-like phospholipase family protein [Phycisphaerae bacterium]